LKERKIGIDLYSDEFNVEFKNNLKDTKHEKYRRCCEKCKKNNFNRENVCIWCEQETKTKDTEIEKKIEILEQEDEMLI